MTRFISCVCLFVKISSRTTCKLNIDSSRFNGKVRTTLAAHLLHKSLIESLYVSWDVKISTTRIMTDPNHLVSHRHLEHKELHGFMGYFSRNCINQSCTCEVFSGLTKEMFPLENSAQNYTIWPQTFKHRFEKRIIQQSFSLTFRRSKSLNGKPLD